MAIQHQIQIAGIDVSAYVVGADDAVKRNLAFPIAEADLTLKQNVSNIITLAAGQTVKIWRTYNGTFANAQLIFVGTIESFEQQDVTYTLLCYDALNPTKIRTANRIFLSSDTEAGKLSEIFKTLINTYAGLTANSTSVTDSGSTNILQQFACNNAYVNERADALNQALNWRYYYDPITALVWFGPMKATMNPNPINASSISSKPVWTSDKTSLANYVRLEGALVTVQTSQTFSGTGGLDVFTLANKPFSVQVNDSGLSPTLQVGGQQGDPGINYYVNIPKNQVVFVTNTHSGSNNVTVAYSYQRPLPIIASNAASIATYGIQEKVITYTDLSTLNDANTRVALFVATYAQPFTICTANVKNSINAGYDIGQTVSIIDPYTGQTATLMVRALTFKLRDVKDLIELGDEEFRIESWLNVDVQGRVKKLEEQLTSQTSITYPLVQTPHTQPAKRKSMAITVTRINDSFIADHPINGATDRGQILDDFETGVANWSGTNCTVSSES